MNEYKGRMPTKIELTMEQSQQGVSNDVLGIPVRVEFDDATATTDPIGANAIARSFPHTYGGSEGLFAQETLDMIDDDLATYKNQACKALNLDGLDIVGDTSQLAETFTEAKCATMVVGVPVTLNGDLKNQFIETNVGFDTICKYYYFIRIMGRKASHVAVECTLQSHPNLLPIPTHPSFLPNLIVGLDRCLQYYTSKAKSGCGSRNTFIPAMLALPRYFSNGLSKKFELTLWCMIRRDSKTMVLLVLLAGGLSHAFTLQDSRQIKDDFKSLRDLFWANGDGFQWIHVTLETYGSSAKSRLLLPSTTGQWSPSNPNTLLHVLCCRNDDAALNSSAYTRASSCKSANAWKDIIVAVNKTVSFIFENNGNETLPLNKLITSLRDRIVSGLLLCMVSETDFEELKLKDYVEMTKDFV
uniref:Pyrophosphate--fructose 6-phosphate 1-phosphotransferase subunit alpha n=1 Tax=Tanacetum cinerariifolium TaxID=118510 RepID=A0A6L2L5K1_TANCI|nr:pyrophosphate--fructose 6-phosphate 1-phosphotransferase subunit alpha [Tanacetum cinerariifolium]